MLKQQDYSGCLHWIKNDRFASNIRGCLSFLSGAQHLEYGAQWIHGEEGNVVFDFAKENNLIDEEYTLLQSGI